MVAIPSIFDTAWIKFLLALYIKVSNIRVPNIGTIICELHKVLLQKLMAAAPVCRNSEMSTK